ncbi:MAG: hypothetical protein JWP97_349 [Labilithrix sp.]|nr:hypothetical protein [Labilithrix sp.]
MAELADAAEQEARAARRRYTIFLVASLTLGALVIVAAHAVVLPFVLAIVIAYVLTPLVAWVEKRRVPRAVAIILVYVVVLGSMGLFVRLTAPRVGSELASLRRELPAAQRAVRTVWVPAIQERLRAAGLGSEARPPVDVDGDGKPDEAAAEPGFDIDHMVADAAGRSVAYARHNAFELVKIGRDIIAGVSRVVFIFGITLMLAAYLMLTREKIMAFFASLARPSWRPSWYELVARIDRGLVGVVRGQLIICVLNGLLSAVGFAIVGLKYWPVLALVATVLSLIPIFGSILSAIPAVALGLTQSVGTAVFVLAWIVGIHQLEANLLNPKIMGDAAKIHPVLVIFSLLVGEHFFHTVGALLAVPSMSIAQSVFLHVRDRLRRADPELAPELALESAGGGLLAEDPPPR